VPHPHPHPNWGSHPAGIDETELGARAGEAGVAVGSLAERRIEPGPPGLILGYGGIVESAIEPGVRALASIVADVRRGPA
jgi:GntR family transcriptional regulator/MocR family aminotransferase